MRNSSLRLHFAGAVVLAFLWLASPAVAQQDGPLPPAPPVQPSTQSPAAQNPAASSPSAQPSTGTAPAQPSSSSDATPSTGSGSGAPAATASSRNANTKVEVPGGTHIPLVLHN